MITCSECNGTFGVRPDVLQKRLDNANIKGDLETGLKELEKTYKCQKCREHVSGKSFTITMSNGDIVESKGNKAKWWNNKISALMERTKGRPLNPTECNELDEYVLNLLEAHRNDTTTKQWTANKVEGIK